MTTTIHTSAVFATFFDYAARNRLQLFPVRADTKVPACPWKSESSSDPAQWRKWVDAGQMLGISACASDIVLVDVDVKIGIENAWQFVHGWFADKLNVDAQRLIPFCLSPNGGWHYAFRCPDGFDPAQHRGTISIKQAGHEVISIRNRGYTVAPGSVFGGKSYQLKADAPIYAMPPALVEMLELPVIDATANGRAGESDYKDVAGLVAFLDAQGEFDTEPEWFAALGAVKLALGDTEAGLEVARQITNDTATEEALLSRWSRLSTDARPRDFKIGSLIKRARDLGWKGRVGKSTSAMFAGALPTVASPSLVPAANGLIGPLPNHPELTASQANVLAEYWAHIPSGKMICERTSELCNAASIDKHLGHVKDFMKSGPGQLASTWLSQHRFVDSMGWAPGESKIVKDKVLTKEGWLRASGKSTFNLYVPSDIERVEGDVSPWLNHTRFIYPSEADHIVCYLAFKVQHPGDKINHGLVFIGDPGIGKDTIMEPVVAAIGSHNCKSISASTFFKSDFNGYLKSVMLRIDEVHDLGGESKYAFHDRTKTVLAAPPMAHQINEKFVPVHAAVNVCGTILTTNHTDALYLPRDDRRHFVCVSDRKQSDFPGGYFDGLYAWFESGGNEAVAHFLANLDLSGFNAKASPPKTTGWHMIVAAGLAPETGDLTDIIETLNKPAAVRIEEIRLAAQPGSALHSLFNDPKMRKAIPKRLADAGYMPVANPDAASDGRWRIHKSKTTIYAQRELSEGDRLSAARALVVKASLPPPLPTIGG